MQNTPLPWPYITGLFQCDGSFSIIFRREKTNTFHYRVVPEATLSQNNLHLRERYIFTLESPGIAVSKSTFSPGKGVKGSRTPKVRVEGIENIKLLFSKIDSCGGRFYGIKYLDYCIMKSVLQIIENQAHNQWLGREQIIDLKYEMHKPVPLKAHMLLLLKKVMPNTTVPFVTLEDVSTHITIPPSFRNTKAECRKKQGLQPRDPGATPSLMSTILETIEKDCFSLLHSVIHAQQPNPLNIDSGFLAGALNGNGNFHRQKDGTWRVSISAARGNEFLVLALSSMIGDKNPRYYRLGSKAADCYVRSTQEKQLHLAQLLEPSAFVIKTQQFGEFKNWIHHIWKARTN